MDVNIKTQEQINQDMLDNIDNGYEKSIGWLTGDMTKTNSIELGKIYTVIAELLGKIDVNNLTGDELTKYVLQRKGIKRKEATYAKAVLTIVGNGTINIDDSFATANNIEFKATETKVIAGTDTINAQAVISGTSGNVGANTITTMPITLTGITGVNNADASYDGFSSETDVDVRERYYLELQKPPTSGNIYHYLSWVMEVSGVGNAKIIPLWDGQNTVQVIIINADMLPPSQDLINAVQTYIDPNSNGLGEGQAPIGAYTTVVGAIGVPVNVEVDITKTVGADDIAIKNQIAQKVSDYLKSIAFDDSHLFVSYAKIGALILEVDGVTDYSVLELNDTTANITIPSGQVAVLDTVTLL